jgi:hypothetical protein
MKMATGSAEPTDGRRHSGEKEGDTVVGGALEVDLLVRLGLGVCLDTKNGRK